jgi:nucleoside-diphosphate-sugar epimerase
VSYANKKVLVTGATGFIGGRLAERLVFEHGGEVRALVRDWRKAVWLSRLPVTIVEGDVTDRPSLDRAMAGCDVVFHCVGVGGNETTCRAVNVQGTANVLEAALTAGVKQVVYLSSHAVLGPNPPANAGDHTPMVRTGSAYGDSKVDAEEVVAAFTARHTLPVVILRPTFVWGPRSEWFTVYPIQQIKGRAWQLVNRGRGTCHAVYVDNLVTAMLLAGEKPQAAGEAFLITDDQPWTWGDFFLSYARMLGKRSLPSVSPRWVRTSAANKLDRVFGRTYGFLESNLPTLEPFRFAMRVVNFGIKHVRLAAGTHTDLPEWDLVKYARRGPLDTSKARDLLHYRPSVSVRDGMRQTEEWLRAHGVIERAAGAPAGRS